MYLIGISRPHLSGFEQYFADTQQTWVTDPIEDDPVAIVEAAGRVCYRSWANKRGQTRSQYLRNSIIDAKHFSVIRHLTYNFLISDLPRSTQLELVRHQAGTAPSFESQRFTDARLRFCLPPLYRDDSTAVATFAAACRYLVAEYEMLEEIGQKKLAAHEEATGVKLAKTLKRKRAKEAARSILPNAAGSDGVYSMNAQAVRWVTSLRSAEAADQSFRELAAAVFEIANEATPALFQDALITELAGQTPIIEFSATQ